MMIKNRYERIIAAAPERIAAGMTLLPDDPYATRAGLDAILALTGPRAGRTSSGRRSRRTWSSTA